MKINQESIIFLLLQVCIVFTFLIPLVTADTKQQVCPVRNVATALAVGRRCRKKCSPIIGNCRSNRICMCARECGYSCINLQNFCEAPSTIENMESVQVMRKYSNLVLPVLDLPYRFDDVAVYTCSPGFRIEGPLVHSYCHGRRGWTKPPKCRRACKEFRLSEVRENSMTCGKTCEGDEDCSSNEQCLCDGPCSRTCVNPDIDCGDAPASNDATIEYTGKGFERVAHYLCNDGFYVSSGNTARKCTGGGTWDGQLLSCARVACGDPQPAIRDQFGEVINWRPGPYFVGRTFRFRCLFGHKLLGSSERTCMANGRWSGRTTACNQIDSKTRCPHPGVPVNGRLLSRNKKFRIGDVIQFRCNDGYVLAGESRQECLYFLQWSGNGAPLCLNPRYRDSASEVFQKLQTSTSAIKSRSSASLGRFISAGFGPGHEIYFIFDFSRSVHDNELNSSLEFAVKLIERLTVNATGIIEYGIIIFASDYQVILDIKNLQPGPSEVIQILRNLGKSREIHQELIKFGTHTARAMRALSEQLAFSYLQDRKKLRKRHVFILTDGFHNEGPQPEMYVQRIVQQYQDNPPEFYSITSCAECSGGNDASKAYAELLALANNKLENFILIPNFYLIQEVLDRVTDARTDFNACGRAGDIGSVKQQANAGKVVSGIIAAERAWPWQVIVSLYSPEVVRTLGSGLLGGGSLINNQWVLTAAHLFGRDLQRIQDWKSLVFLTFGLHKRPLTRTAELLPVAKIFRAERVIIHENFTSSTLDFDVTLIKIGQEYIQNGTIWSPVANYGWINFTDFIRPVCLPCVEGNCIGQHLTRLGYLTGNETDEERCRIESNFLLENEKENKNFLSVVTGFGHTTERRNNQRTRISEYLRQGLIKVEGDERCTESTTRYIPWGIRTPIRFTKQMICGTSGIAGENVDACQGDSGGPLVREVLFDPEKTDGCWVQIGIVSWGWGCGLNVTRGGIARQLPGFYTNVPSVISWIKSHVHITQVD